jgi:FG-GAP-like repeat/ASPIC and UnbV
MKPDAGRKGRSTAVVMVVLGLVFALAGSAFAWLRYAGSTMKTAATKRPNLVYSERKAVDTSGFTAILPALPRWSESASLEEVRETFRGAGARDIAKIDATLAMQSVPEQQQIVLRLVKAAIFQYEADPKRCSQELEEARAWLASRDAIAQQWLYSVIFFQGISAMRLGENENCILCRGESSCIVPLAAAAVHLKPEGSRAAIGYFTEYLEQFGDDVGVQWLLNVAHMTLGEYPSKVDPRFLLDLDRFLFSGPGIGKFRDVGHLLGVNRLNQAGGAIMDDFDGDRLLDIVVTTMDPTGAMAFYRNRGDGTFEDRSEAAGVTGQLGGLVCYQTDFNNDGRLDVYIPRGAWLPHGVRPSLLRNEGEGRFTDVTEGAGLAQAANSNAAAWADYDNDGWLDLFVACEKQLNRLYHNRRDGTFEEVAAKAKVHGELQQWKGCTWIDYDNDRYPDLFVNSMSGLARLYHNERNGSFTDSTGELGINGPRGGFACWSWDYDNDGWLDIFATSYDRSLSDVVRGLLGRTHSKASSRLYRNKGGKGFDDKIAESGLDMVFSAMGCNFGDFDNDGWLDFYLGTGDPDLSTLIPNRMFRNLSGGRFAEITGSSGTGHLQKGHAVACGDWDNDGDVDIFIEMGGALNGDKYHNIMFQNPGQGNNSLTVKLVGSRTNRAAIGARIKVVTAGKEPLSIHRHVTSGSSFGANPLQQTIGLGKADRVAVLQIDWPTSATTQVFRDVPVNQSIEITELEKDYKTLKSAVIALPE